MGWRGVVGLARGSRSVPATPWQTCGNLSVIGNRMLIGSRDTFPLDKITDVIADLSDHPIRYETIIRMYG